MESSTEPGTWAEAAPGAATAEFRGYSAAELARRIADGEFSSERIVAMHLRQIELIEPRLNAVTQRRSEQALEEARAADQFLLRQGPSGPLHGVPVSVKETFDVAGMATGWGCTADALQPVEHDAAAVARLKAAGAIVVAKTNVSQLGLFFESDNPVHGHTNNPWDTRRTCGGSSGGEAALVAAGGVPLGLGSDLGGSIRIPAHFCGIHGLKPTSAAVSNRGLRWLLLGGSIDCVPGPLARRVEDLVVAYNVLADRDRLGSAVDGQPTLPCDPTRVSLGKLRVGVWSGDDFFPPSPGIRAAVEQAASDLDRQAVQLASFQPPSAAEILELYMGLVSADGGAGIRRALAGSQLDPRLRNMLRIASLSPVIRWPLAALARWRGQEVQSRLLMASRKRSTDRFWRLRESLESFRADFRVRWQEAGLDALLLPPFGLAAVPHGRSVDLLAAGTYSLLANLLGTPAGVVTTTRISEGHESDRILGRDRVPQLAAVVERDSAGLPIGVQIMAARWQESVVARLMLALEPQVPSGGRPLPRPT